MRKLLTIGELSKMLGISTHRIRHYETLGLIQPAEISDGGYRMYDYSEVYIVGAIMMMRDSQISLKDIKELLDNRSKEEYLKIFRKSYQTLQDQIEKLIKLKQQMDENIKLIEQIDLKDCIFEYKDYPLRKLIIVKQSDFTMNYSVKELYNEYSRHSIDTSKLYQSDVIYYFANDKINYCVIDNDDRHNVEGIDCKGGQYLCYTRYDAEDLIEESINEFSNYITANRIQYEGKLLLYIKVGVPFLSQTGYPIELQIKVK